MAFSSRTMTDADWPEMAPAFARHEFHYPERMGYEFLLWLKAVREKAGVPMHPSSDYRDPARNAKAGGASKSAHMDTPCDAADFAGKKPGKPMSSKDRLRIVSAALALGCVRLGVYENGSVHLDRTEDIRPAALWVTV